MVRVQQGPISINGVVFPPEGGDITGLTPRVSITTTPYTLQLSDMNKVVEMNFLTEANTVIVPLTSTVAFPIGATIGIFQREDGVTTISPETGVTLQSFNGQTGARTLAGQYAPAYLRKRSTDSWELNGELV